MLPYLAVLVFLLVWQSSCILGRYHLLLSMQQAHAVASLFAVLQNLYQSPQCHDGYGTCATTAAITTAEEWLKAVVEMLVRSEEHICKGVAVAGALASSPTACSLRYVGSSEIFASPASWFCS